MKQRRDQGPIVGAKPPLIERMLADFSLKRGAKGFVIGLLVSPFIILVKSFRSDEFHWEGMPIVMLLVAIAGGLWGLFTRKVFPL